MRTLSMDMDHAGWEDIRHLYMLILQRCPHDSDQEDEAKQKFDTTEGILLVPQQGRDNVFKRVGLFVANGVSTVAKILGEYETAESTVITLV
jgi:hypothetical protein